MAIQLATIASGTGGFVIHGAVALDDTGISVDSAGDVNGDGFVDLLIGAQPPNGQPGMAYVVFGQAARISTAIDLVNVEAGSGGFVVNGEQPGDNLGTLKISSAGDVNGDGFADLLLGMPYPNNSHGKSYVVFGHAGGFPPAIDLADVAAGTGGFVLPEISGHRSGDLSGLDVSDAGDVNADGFGDFLIGAPLGDGPGDTRPNAGDSYLVFGHSGTFPAQLSLSEIASGMGGLVIYGEDAGDESGFTVGSAGDLNGDGFDDFAMGAWGGDGPGNARNGAGDTYVVFGNSDLSRPSIDLHSIAGNGGLILHGAVAGDLSGYGFASGGDINGDGIDDLIVGAAGSGGPSPPPGKAYVVFGSVGGFSGEIDLASMAVGVGFVIIGRDAGDNTGRRVSSAGDVNGDGYDDLFVAASGADGSTNTQVDTGEAYVVFGHAGAFPGQVNLSDVAAGSGGFVIYGERNRDYAGVGLSSAGDIDGDGFSDLIIGASGADGPNDARSGAGDTYVIYGSATLGGSPNHLTQPAGGAGNDTLTGSTGIDILNGGRGGDTFVGNGGADVFTGGEGNDTFTIADAGFRRITGGTGDDVLLLTGANPLSESDFNRIDGVEILKLANVVDTLTLGPVAGHAFDGAVHVDGTLVVTHNVTVDGSALNKAFIADLSHDGQGVTLSGGAGDNILSGGSGADTLRAGTGLNTLDGGLGNDSYIVGSLSDVILDGAGEGTADRVFARTSYVLTSGAQIEIVSTTNNAGTVAIDLTGNALGNTIYGNAGSNTLSGLGGNDTLIGLDGNDTLIGGAGGDDLQGGAGIDTVSYASSPSAVTIAIGSSIGSGGDAQGDVLRDVENLVGSAFDDVLIGDAANNVLTGGAGADYLDGKAGTNTVSYATSALGVTIDLHNHSGSGGDAQGDTYFNIQNATGSAFDDMLIAGPGNNVLNGGAGNDWYFVDNAGDTVVDGFAQGTLDRVFASASYTLSEGAQVEVLSTDRNAGTAAIDFTGNSLGSTIYGNDGNNRLTGKAGNDVLVGLGGSDTFVYTQAAGVADDDQIYGFDAVNAHAGHDVIDVSGRGLHFADLGIAPAAGGIDTLISLPGTDSIYLFGVSSGQLDAGDFVGLI